MRLRNILLSKPRKFWFTKFFNALKYFLTRKNINLNLKYLPLTMDIEPTTGCNFRCTMCQVSEPDFKAFNMDFDIFKKVINQNKQLIKIKLQGMGEPFVHKKFFDMIDYANQHGISVEFVSNGSLLNDSNIKKIINHDISRISISIDGASKKIFESIRIKSNFENVISNVRNLSKIIKDKKLKVDFDALCLVQKKNFHEILEITRLCKDIGFHSLYFQVQLTGWGKEEWEEINKKEDVNYETSNVKEVFEKIVQEESTENFNVKVVEENLLSFDKRCSYPFETPYISSTGKVVPCCMIADDKVINFGSIKENNFKDIWNSKDFQNFRNDIKINNLRDYCKNCYKEFRK